MKRRSFLSTSAVATFGFQFVPAHVVRAQEGAKTPSNKVRLAVIGCGGQGGADLGGMADEDIVALCDVDDRRAADSFGKFPKARRFKDFRKMFDAMSNDIDAVLVATPDHTHAVATLAAIGHGKHVYCEKPLAHSIGEVRAMRKAALEKNVITQVGNQGHSSESIRVFCEMVWSGAIGKVSEIHAGCDAFKDVYCQTRHQQMLQTEKPPVPSELDWDLWLGPLTDRPYHSAYLPFNWRGFSAFGSGCIGDWVCHVLDPSFWALDLGLPTAITAETKGYDPKQHAEFYPQGARITFEFPAKGDRGPVKIIWHDKSIARVKGGHHQNDWLDAIRANRQAGSNFEYGGALSEIGLLGMIAIRRSGTRLEWDAQQMKFTNDEEANQFITPTFRQGWSI